MRELVKRIVKDRPVLERLVRSVVGAVYRIEDFLEHEKYATWLKGDEVSASGVQDQVRIAMNFAFRPLISIVVPVYNPSETFFTAMVESVLCQSYDNWELLLVDDASGNKVLGERMKMYAQKDPRIRCMFLKKNGGISGATNNAIDMARGDYVALLDHDDVLRPDALFEIVSALNSKRFRLLYTDSDQVIGPSSRRVQPMYKPDWNLDFMRSVNYITHLLVVERTLLQTVGGMDSAYDGAQDWEFILRCARNIRDEDICHIPKVLYSWRVHEGSTAYSLEAKPYALAAGRKAIQDDLQERMLEGRVIGDERYKGYWKAEYAYEGTAKVLVLLIEKAARPSVQRAVQNTTTHSQVDVHIVPASKAAIEKILSSETTHVIVIDRPLRSKKAASRWIEEMLGDSQLKVRFVLARTNHKQVIQNLRGMIKDHLLHRVKRLSMRTTIKHLYTSTKYAIFQAHGGIVLFTARNFREALDNIPKGSMITIESLTRKTAGQRDRHGLYDPYIKV